jgi:hypothetical protein
MVSRAIPSTQINFGAKYEPEKMRVLSDHLARMTKEIQRLQQALSGGQAGQVLGKINGDDYRTSWTAAGGSEATVDGPFLITEVTPGLPQARVFTPDLAYFTVDDGGDGSTYRVTLADYSIGSLKLAKIPPFSVLGNVTEDVDSVQAIQAGTDGLFLGRVAGVLGFFAPGTSTPGNPTAKVGPTAVNGTATTYMRSDGAPALDVDADFDTTGQWTFKKVPTVGGVKLAKLVATLRPATFIGTSALTTPIEPVYIIVPFDCVLTKVTVLTQGGPGSCAIGVWKDTYANFPPDASDSITGVTPPVITADIKYVDSVLDGWTVNFTAGDIIAVNIDSTSTFTMVHVNLEVTPT